MEYRKALAVLSAFLCILVLVSCDSEPAVLSPAAGLLTHGGGTVASEDALLLGRLIEAEAGALPYAVRVCIAALVLNRVESADFPDTVGEVILEDGAFESVKSGRIWDVSREDVQKLTAKAIREALLGRDPTGGAVYFSTAEDAPSCFVVPSYECGGMVFGS